MEKQMVTLDELEQLPEKVLIDVRTPSEYQKATIPGAISIPLFDDDERSQVGIVYKQICKKKARDLGYQLVLPKLPGILQSIREVSTGHSHIILFCWRGGLRSKTLTKYCNQQGVRVSYLVGGYKAFRKKVYLFFEEISNIPKAIVLVGLTGVGKTRLFDYLAPYGLSAIDLEQLANNRGSVFGKVHGGEQPSQQAFEAALYTKIREIYSSHLIVECESKRIGRLQLPDTLVKRMKDGFKLHLYADLQARLERIVEDYGKYPEERLINALGMLKDRLGKEKINYLAEQIKNKNHYDVVSVLLREYYDPLYGYPDKKSDKYDASIDCNDLEYAAKEVFCLLNKGV